MSTHEELVRQAKAGVVVGLKALTGQVKPRLDIDVFLTQHPDAFNLMLQAISKMQKDPGPLGYYALSGIHGLPSLPWDDVDKRFPSGYGGYCAHGVLTFPTWHRPYLSLYEQTIYLNMVEIAESYKNATDRQKYLNAAKEFRLPYLDYFRARGGTVSFPGVSGNLNSRRTSFPFDFRLPDILSVKKVTVRTAPDSVLNDNFDNPLYAYKFSEKTGQLPQGDQNAIRQWYSLKQTVRHPANITADTHNLAAQSDALNNGREGRSPLLLKLLNSKPYALLSTVASDSLEPGDLTVQQGNGSLESIHGNYHMLIGGRGSTQGHMGDPSVAAFDPVFWFHHCNVDRYWAIWTALHPEAWFPQPKNVSIKAENKKDLLPFYKVRNAATPGEGEFYNSDDAKTTDFFGYIYDDFKDIPDGSDFWKEFTARYEWSSRTPDHPRITDPPQKMRPLDVKATQFFQKASIRSAAAASVASAGAATVQKLSTLAHSTAITQNLNLVSVASAASTGSVSVASANTANKPVASEAQAKVDPVAHAPAAQIAISSTRTSIDPTFDRNWYLDSSVRRSASNGAFTIFFFLAKPGQINEDISTFERSPFLAGVNHIFAAPKEICDNCGDLEAAGALASDTSLITPLLLDYLDLPDNGLESLRPEHVKPFLIKYLRWRVVYHDNAIRDTRTVPELKIGVSAEVYQGDGSKTYEDYPDVVGAILQNASETATAATA